MKIGSLYGVCNIEQVDNFLERNIYKNCVIMWSFCGFSIFSWGTIIIYKVSA